MTSPKFTESVLEDAVLEWFDELGYKTAFGPDLAPDGESPERKTYQDVVLVNRLRVALARINPTIPAEAIQDAVDKITAVPWTIGGAVTANHSFHKFVQEGVDVAYKDADNFLRGDKVYLFDTANVDNNDWLAINQFTIIENNHNRRPDVIIFINGLPLAVFELKNPADANATAAGAFNQIQTYKAEIGSLFAYNEFCIIADHVKNALVGTITSDTERFVGWKSVDGNNVSPTNDLDILIKGMFTKDRFLDIIKNFIVFMPMGKESVKVLAGYHQYFATNKAVAATLLASSPTGDRRCGVVWHTQGSGKSLSMTFYAGKIIQILNNPTLVVLTDRNDLDDQLFGGFAGCKELLRQTPAQAQDRGDLKKLLSVDSGGVVFTTIQKFMPEEKGEKHPMLSDRTNIVVIADEAHRTQYDFIDGFARHMHDALPNASFIGFTGTPIELSDKNTRAVFGEYIDVYDIRRAVADKATVPIYFEPRLAKIELVKEVTPQLDADFEELTEGEEIEKKEKLKSKWARLEAMIGSEKRVALIAQDVVKHFEARLSALDGKGMFVAMSRRIAVELYNEIIKLRPQWENDDISKGFIKVVMTGAASDPAEFRKHIHSKEDRDKLALRMKDPKDELKLVIVRDMWLTGFDAPCMHTLYVDKPMQGHGLMQAIARVNRVYKNKPGGLVVDYLGIAPSLKVAVENYSQSGDIAPTIDQQEAVNLMREKFETIKSMYHGFDYSLYFSGKAADKATIAGKAMDFILGLENGKQRYAKLVAELSQAFALSVPSEEAMEIRDDLAFYQAVNGFIKSFDQSGGLGGPSADDYDQAIKQMVSDAVVSDKVINIFDAAGLQTPNVAVLSDEFLNDVQGLERKNVALEVLKKLLNDELRSMEKKFLVKSRSFSHMLEETIKRYQNQTIEAAQVIAELVELAKKIREEKNQALEMGLTDDELAFYDALCQNDSAVMELGDDTLKAIAREVVALVHKNATIDWTMKESVRARLRVFVKRALNKYKYPPDKQDAATKLVLEQAELIGKDWGGE